MSPPVSEKRTALLAMARERILVLDGAMGTMIQGLQYDEAAFRGARFADFHRDLRGNNDLLILTQPKAIEDIHADYLRAGADIVATNTFSSTSIAQADYDLSGFAYELNREGARLAHSAAARVYAEDGRPRFVAGAIGPTNRTASISPDVSNPGFRAVSFDDLRLAYGEQINGLLDGGADLLLVERGLFESRARAQAAIEAGLVTANDKQVVKPSEGVAADAILQAQPAHPFVSRGGVKLTGALEQYPIDIEDHVCLDIGASTGGFTEVLLAGGAVRVYALDVGHGQLHSRLWRDPRIVMRDGAMQKVIVTKDEEKGVAQEIRKLDDLLLGLRQRIRIGEELNLVELHERLRELGYVA